jgi:hypothetical protein
MIEPAVRSPAARAAVLLITLTLFLGAGSARPPSPTAWRTGRPVVIPTAVGKASFDIPSSSSGSRTILVVSSLSRDPGPFTIRVKTTIKPGAPAPIPGERPSITRTPDRPISQASPERWAPPSTMPAAERVFHIMAREGDVASASNYVAIRSTLRAVGKRVAIYVDPNDLGIVSQDLLREVAETFDEKILPTTTRLWGPAHDVDHDGRFTIFLTSWLGRLGAGRLATDGFVRGADFDTSLTAPFGNHCDMMYLNASLEPGAHLRTILAHEYTHAVIFSRKAIGRGGVRAGGEEEGWLDEALAHLAEDLFGFSRSNLDYRVDAFLAAPERYRLVVDDYYTANLFRSHGHRGGAYLFLRWCADQYGPGLVNSLIRSPKHGIASLEAATGSSFDDLFRRWTVDLATSGFSKTDDSGGASHRDSRAEVSATEAGPRMTWLAAGDHHEWSSGGTAAHFLTIGSSPTGCTRVEVEAAATTNLQVTAIPVPENLPRLELTVRNATQPGGDPAIAVAVRELTGNEVHLQKLCWGPMIPSANPRGSAAANSGLGSARLAAALGTTKINSSGRLVSGPIAITPIRDGSGSFFLKLIGTDGAGRAVSAWAVLDRPAD